MNPENNFVFIHSHRRSGTHFLIDVISTWFEIGPGYYHFPLPEIDSSELGAPRSDLRKLVKTHEPRYGFILGEQHVWSSQESLKQGIRLYNASPHIYIVRNPYNVLRSLYVFDLMGGEPKFKIDDKHSMSDYLLGISMHEDNTERLNRIEYWSQHVRRWVSTPGILPIDYEKLVTSRDSVLEKISQHIGIRTRSSPNTTTPTGIGRYFTDRFLAQGGDAAWSADIVQAVKTTLERMAAEQSVLEPYVTNWLLATP